MVEQRGVGILVGGQFRGDLGGVLGCVEPFEPLAQADKSIDLLPFRQDAQVLRAIR